MCVCVCVDPLSALSLFFPSPFHFLPTPSTESVCPQPSMVVTPQRHTVVQGQANICRFLCRRFCPELYEGLGPEVSSEIDGWMDSISLTFIHGNAKEKTSVLRHMNSSLGSTSFLVNTNQISPTAADILGFSILAPRQGLKLGGNVKSWMRRCHDDPHLSSIPCMYLTET